MQRSCEVQDVLNCSAHDLRITPHQNVDVVDQQADARDAYDRDQDVHVTAPSENHGWHPSPSAWDLRITPHQNVDVVDQQADARDAYDRDQDVHVTAPSENHGWHPSPSAW